MTTLPGRVLRSILAMSVTLALIGLALPGPARAAAACWCCGACGAGERRSH